MEHLSQELDLWRLIWVRVAELKLELQRGTLPISLGRTHYDSRPHHNVIFVRHSKNGVTNRVLLDYLEIFNQAPFCVCCHFQL